MWFGRWAWVISLCQGGACGCSSSEPPASSAAGAVSCAPLEAVTTRVSLVASAILAVGQSADGTLYVLSEVDSRLQLFVSVDGTLTEQPEAGTGEVNDGDVHTILFSYTDPAGAPVSVQLRRDASGLRMAVLHGTSSEKIWDIETEGEALTVVEPQTALAMPATTTQRFGLDYEGARANGELLVVIAPQNASTYDDFRLFWGAPSRLSEAKIQSFSRSRSLDGGATVTFATGTGSAELEYSFPYPQTAGEPSIGSLSIGDNGESLTGSAPPVLPEGVQFLCR